MFNRKRPKMFSYNELSMGDVPYVNACVVSQQSVPASTFKHLLSDNVYKSTALYILYTYG